MSGPSAAPADAAAEIARLEGRVRQLAREKARLELVNYMMGRMGAAPGVEGTVEALLRGIMDHLGGTNAAVWYRRDAAFHRIDAMGARTTLDAPDDPRVARVLQSGRPEEHRQPLGDTGVTIPAAGEACTWIHPLAVGPEVVGVLVMEGQQASGEEFEEALPAFLAHAALLLKHELEVAARLEHAYQQVALSEALRRSQEQLRQAQKMEALGLLAGGVAHDINNILQVIVAFGTALRESLADRAGQHADLEAIDEVLAGAQRAGELTRGLLAFSRRQPLEQKAVDLGRLAGETQRFLERLLGPDTRLVTRLARDELVVNADPSLLQQVLVNLVTNARDAMPGGGEVVVSTEALPEGSRPSAGEGELLCGEPVCGPAASLVVTDTGGGMSPEVLARVTEPFFTTKAKGKGTGLGLSVVYGIVKQHGGQLRVRSAPGQGTRVEVTLPRLDARPAEDRAARARPAAANGESILVAEDDAAVRNAVRAVLAGAGYRVALAADGQEAVECILGLAPGQRALFMSGYAAEAIDTRRLKDLGVPVIMKPFAPEALLLAVQGQLEQPGPGPARRADHT